MVIEQLSEDVQITNSGNNAECTTDDITSEIQSVITSFEKVRYVERNGMEMSITTMTMNNV